MANAADIDAPCDGKCTLEVPPVEVGRDISYEQRLSSCARGQRVVATMQRIDQLHDDAVSIQITIIVGLHC